MSYLRTMLFTLCLLTFLTAWSHPKPSEHLNIYLKADQPRITLHVHRINQRLKHKGLLKTYHIEPFEKKYPMHVTLYLAEFKAEKTDELLKRVARLARHWKPFELSSEQLQWGAGGYLMLHVAYTHPTPENKLYELSNAVVRVLSPLRFRKAPPPEWALHSKELLLTFKQFGSPSVGVFYHPHITLFAKTFKNSKQSQAFQKAIEQFLRTQEKKGLPRTSFQAANLAVGVANEQGQITKEIASFPLNGIVF